MSHDSHGKSGATVPLPDDMDPIDERKAAETAAATEIDERLRRGALSPQDADREIIELALRRFDFLPDAAREDARRMLRDLFETEPELVETHTYAPSPEEPS